MKSDAYRVFKLEQIYPMPKPILFDLSKSYTADNGALATSRLDTTLKRDPAWL